MKAGAGADVISKFLVGGQYWNDRGRYEVLEIVEIDGADQLLVRFEDRSEDILDAGGEARRRAARVLHENGVEHLYHFTSLYNLKGIREVGAICSKRTLGLLERWPVRVPGGDELSHRLDRRYGNWGLVHLSFARYTRQYYNRRRCQEYPLALFCLSPEIAGADGVVITDTNATSRDHNRFHGLDEAMPHLDFDTFRPSRRPWTLGPEERERWKRAVQAEILVPTCVPLHFNEKIIVETREHSHFVDEVFGPVSEVVPINDAPRPQLFWDPDEPPPWEPVDD